MSYDIMHTYVLSSHSSHLIIHSSFPPLRSLTCSTPTVPYYRRQTFNNQQMQHAEQSTKALQAAQMINNAKRPLLYVGQGALDR